MKKKSKKIFLIALFILINYLFIYSARGVSFSDDNNPGNYYTAGGSTSEATEWISVGGAAGTQLQVVRVRIYRGKNLVENMDKYFSLANNENGCYSGIQSVIHCKTSSYNYKSVTTKKDVTCNKNQNIKFGCIYGSNLGKSWYFTNNQVVTDGNFLDKYLKKDSYSNLKKLLKSMGYTENNYKKGDFVIIEPATVVKCNKTKYFGTSTALMKQNVSYRGSNDNACSGNDAYNGYTFQHTFNGMSKALAINNKTSYSNTNYKGYGFFKYTVEDSWYPKLKPKYYLDLKGYLDGVFKNSLEDYGTVIIKINGKKKKVNVNDYYDTWPSGTTYEITNITAKKGKKYIGVYSGSIKGTITKNTEVRLEFQTITPKFSNFEIIKTYTKDTDIGSKKSTFGLYKNSSCNGTPYKILVDGISYKLPEGTYSLREESTIAGYAVDVKCHLINIPEMKSISIENKTKCETKFTEVKDNMKKRIELYNEIKSTHNYIGLLSFDNNTADKACKPVSKTQNYEKSCFSASSSSNNLVFNEKNLTMFNDNHGKYTFCMIKYNLSNNLGTFAPNSIKSGQPIIKNNGKVATGELIRTCYNYGDQKSPPALDYSNYITVGPAIGGEKLISLTPNKTLTTTEASGYVKTEEKIIVNYKLPNMYASNKDGKVYYNSCPSGEYCKKIGRGIISIFNSTPGDKLINFNIKLKGFGNLKGSSQDSDCKYKIENELINYKNKLNIEFRTVNTYGDDIFLSKTGAKKRKIGNNWNILTEAERKKILILNNNSYNKKNESEPLYKIILKPKDIKKIREKDAGVEYDNYNMTCVENGKICISNYLTCLKNDGILKIKNRKNEDKFTADQIKCTWR